MKTDIQTGVMCVQAKERQGLLAAARHTRHKEDPPLEPLEGAGPPNTLILGFRPPELGENKSVSFEAPSL